ncbi:MAG: ammonium transporter, partial [Anaerolineae bacterium]|nr:ammonium transporter [Anaerolineae bacterium]
MNKSRRRLWVRLIAMAIATAMLAIFGTTITLAQDVVDPTANALAALEVSINSTFIFIAAIFVFFMQAGFAFLEAGMIRQRGAVNSLMENFM